MTNGHARPTPPDGDRGGRPCTAGSRVEIAGECAWFCVPSLHEGHGTFQLFTEGDELYDAMISAIEGAEHDVEMESFIFAADEVGRRFATAFAASSEEHTSELQSLMRNSYAVFRLKKKISHAYFV